MAAKTKENTTKGLFSTLENKLILILLFAVFTYVLVKTAWVSDDAYVTFRVLDNFVNGYGLRWNVMERVQAFTHPLWLFLLVPFYLFTSEIFFTSIFVSMGLSLLALFVLTNKISSSMKGAVIAALPLILSKAFIDYSTSGLENALTHVILVWFSYLFLTKKMSLKIFGLMTLATFLGVLNRMDILLLFAPALIWGGLELRKGDENGKNTVSWKKLIGVAALGASPFILWEIFSLIYYGFPFPNTAYAKLGAGVPTLELVQQGFLYIMNSINWDPITMVTITLGALLPILMKNKKLMMLSIGVMLYLLYVLKIGGGFMSGRFLTAPLFVSAIILSRLIKPSFKAMPALLITILILGIMPSRSPIRATESYTVPKTKSGVLFIPPNGVADERGYYFRESGLIHATRGTEMPTFEWAEVGKEMRLEGKVALMTGAIGMIGYFAGPNVLFMDYHALSDPLLARLPAMTEDDYWLAVAGEPGWRIGHFRRNFPKGYPETLLNSVKENLIENQDIKLYYDKLHSIVGGPIWSGERFSNIIAMNLGEYDYLLESFDPDDTVTADYYADLLKNERANVSYSSNLEKEEVGEDKKE
ncbi:hypothetical protein HOG48_02010 [Candidatus Peregrinibacteria bacterium]|nr:hypothetical protein [Candidatus Peregrinibacteria bacterium]